MMDLRSFCGEFGIDESAAAAALERPDGDGGSPWYARAFPALGAWVTAIAIVAFFGLFIPLIGDDATVYIFMALGVACFALGLRMLAKTPNGAFRASFATALAAAGACIATPMIGSTTGLVLGSVFVSFVFAGLVIAWAPDMVLQLLVSGLALASIAVTLVVDELPYFLDIAALLPVAGVLLWVRPPRVDVRPTALAMLLTVPVLSIFALFAEPWFDVPVGGWTARAVHVALFVWLVSILWRRIAGPGDQRGERIKLGVFAAAAVAVVLLLPAGGSAALVIMTLAFVLGSRPLALLGVLLEAFFFWQFYYDLDISLLDKSLLLMAVGLVVLACWWFFAGRRAERAGA